MLLVLSLSVTGCSKWWQTVGDGPEGEEVAFSRVENDRIEAPDRQLPPEGIQTEEPGKNISGRRRRQTEVEKLADKLISYGKRYLGKKYKHGGTGPDRFDCSGLTMTCYKAIGIDIPHSSASQRDTGRKLRLSEPLQRGDLVFFAPRSGNRKQIGHVGIVVDADNRRHTFTFLHAAVHNGVEIQSSEAEYYNVRYIGANRVLPDF